MQVAPVVLKDGLGTDVVYAPRDITNGVATFVKSNGVPIADKRLSVNKTRNAQSGREKVTMKLVVPVVQDVVVNGVSRPTVVRTAYADITLTFDGTSTTQERTDCRAMAYFLLNTPMTIDVVDDLQSLY